MTDRELLNEYAHKGREEAFTELLNRHGPMAYSSALRVLDDPHLAEDAVQAAFLCLAEKARSLTATTVLAGWIHQAARLAACSLRRERARRVKREREAAAMRPQISTPPSEELSWAEVQPHLDEALAELPAGQREALVQRCLLQRSPTEAAREMGCTEPAVSMRLQRGVEALRSRLRRREVHASGALLSGLMALHATAPLPTELLHTIQAVCLGKAAASVAAAGTTKGVLHAMFWIQLKPYLMAGCMFIFLGLSGGGAWYLARGEDGAASIPGPATEALREGNVELTRSHAGDRPAKQAGNLALEAAKAFGNTILVPFRAGYMEAGEAHYEIKPYSKAAAAILASVWPGANFSKVSVSPLKKPKGFWKLKEWEGVTDNRTVDIGVFIMRPEETEVLPLYALGVIGRMVGGIGRFRLKAITFPSTTADAEAVARVVWALRYDQLLPKVKDFSVIDNGKHTSYTVKQGDVPPIQPDEWVINFSHPGTESTVRIGLPDPGKSGCHVLDCISPPPSPLPAGPRP